MLWSETAPVVDIAGGKEYDPAMMETMDYNPDHKRAAGAGWFYFYFTPPALLVGHKRVSP